MELIVKVTQACNFKCTFCSSTDIALKDGNVLELEKVFQFLERFPETSTIILNGGDPLMIKPPYYWKIIEYLDEHNLPATLSFTTNLWAFFKKPDMWTEIFRHPRVGVCTSFNYGDTRRITHQRVFTDDIFWQVSDLFLERVGYRPDFISVITDENEDTALDNVRLAKEMGVECKLNYAMASGDQDKPYTLSKIYKIYLDVVDAGLEHWEFNTKQLMRRLRGGHTICPQSRTCDSSIRAFNPDGDYYSCGSIADDQEYPIDFEREVLNNEFFLPLKAAPELAYLKEECLSCPMFNICNGCHKTIRDLKKHNMVEEHCAPMKKLAPRILELFPTKASETAPPMPHKPRAPKLIPIYDISGR